MVGASQNNLLQDWHLAGFTDVGLLSKISWLVMFCIDALSYVWLCWQKTCTHHWHTKSMFHLCIPCFIILKNHFLCVSTVLNNKMCEAQCCGVQSSVWRSRSSFKWGPEGTESWTAGHIQREFPHIMGSNTRCRENRGCWLCWLTLHPLTPCRTDIDCLWSIPALKHPVVLRRVKETTHALWWRFGGFCFCFF